MSADAFPTFRRLFRFILRCLRRLRRIFLSRRSAVVYIVLGSVLYLAWTIDRWHGRRAWTAEKERLAAAGESLDLHDLLPKRPPDEENFCAIPELNGLGDPTERLVGGDDPCQMWFARRHVHHPPVPGRRRKLEFAGPPKKGLDAPLDEWCRHFRQTGMLPAQPLAPNAATELLLSAKKWENLLNAMYAATDRPTAVFLPAAVERLDANVQMSQGFPGSEVLHQVWALAESLTLHGRACVETGDIATANSDLRVLQRLAEAFGNDSALTSFLVGELISRSRAAIVRPGIVHHRWDEARLEQLGISSDKESVVSRFCRALAYERTVACQRWKRCRGEDMQFMTSQDGRERFTFWTRWSTWTKVFYARFAPEGPFLRQCALLSKYYSRLISELDSSNPKEPWLVIINRLKAVGMPALFMPNFEDGTIGFIARPLAERRLLYTACRLERHYLTHRRYPATLAEIVDSIPVEAMTDIDGQLLRYRTSPDGSSFRVWSVGLNGRDDTSDPDVPADKNDDWSFSTE